MKGILFLFISSAIALSLIGCQTVPRQLVREETVIIYYEPIIYDLPYIPEPPTPGPPTQPIIRPAIDNPNPPRDQQSKIPDNGGSYGKRDPLKGVSNSGSGEINTVPPVRTPERKNKGRQ
jgi:hypothetical protein